TAARAETARRVPRRARPLPRPAGARRRSRPPGRHRRGRRHRARSTRRGARAMNSRTEAVGAPWLPLALSGLGVAGVAVLALTAAIVITAAGARVSTPSFATNDPSTAALADIPAGYLALYRAAGGRYGLDWAILAAIGKVETDHGRSPL